MINVFNEDGFRVNISKFFEDFKIYRYHKPDGKYSDMDKLTHHLDSITDYYILRVYVRYNECYFIEPSYTDYIASSDDNLTRLSLIMCESLPIRVKAEIMLLLSLRQKKGVLTSYFSVVQKKYGKDVEFTQLFTFNELSGDRIALTMTGKTFINAALYDDKKEANEYVKIGTYMKRAYSEKTNCTLYRGDKKLPYMTRKNELKNAFNTQGLKTEKEAYSQSLVLYSMVCNNIRELEYVESFEPEYIDLQRYEHSLYKKNISTAKSLISGKRYSVVFGKSVPEEEKGGLRNILKPIFDIISEEYNISFEFCDEPFGDTFYIIDENVPGDIVSDDDYAKKFEDCHIQHIGSDTIKDSVKIVNDEPKYNTEIFLNCIAQLMIKNDISAGRSSFYYSDDVYTLYIPYKEKNNEKYELKGADFVRLEKDKLTFGHCDRSNIRVMRHLIDTKYGESTVKPLYTISKGDREESFITVYDTSCFAVPDFNKLMPVVENWISSQNGKVNEYELLNIIDEVGEELQDQKNREEYKEKVISYCDKQGTDIVPIRILVGKNSKFKELLNCRLYEQYGYTIQLSNLKTGATIDEIYPAFFRITYENDPDKEFNSLFIPTAQNPALGFNYLAKRVLERFYVFEGENFIEQVIEFMDFPFSKYKQLSIYPFMQKYLIEYLREKTVV